jgi:type IV pilus assembly protein PilV
MILESLIALLIFSLGILGIIGLQAASIKASTEAKYRSEASTLANEIIGRMWVSDRTAATLKAAFESPGGAAYQNWAWVGNGTSSGSQSAPGVGSVLASLPGASDNLPTIAITTINPTRVTTPPIPATSVVTVTVKWKSPGETTPHNFTTVAQIGG